MGIQAVKSFICIKFNLYTYLQSITSMDESRDTRVHVLLVDKACQLINHGFGPTKVIEGRANSFDSFGMVERVRRLTYFGLDL